MKNKPVLPLRLQFFADGDHSDTTQLKDLIDPEVMADLIVEKLEKKISIIPYAAVDTKLKGRPGDTVSVPTYSWDGEAAEVAEGEEIPIRALGSKMEQYKVKMAAIGTRIYDAAILSGLGDPVGTSTNGIIKSILVKTDVDAMIAMMTASTLFDATKSVNEADRIISYPAVVRAIDLFEEEENTEKVMFVHPLQVTQLRLDPKFLSKETYDNNVMMTGEIGMIGNARVVTSKRVPIIGGCFYNPILKTNVEAETELDTPAITYYIKRDTNVETERKPRIRATEITGDQVYVVARTNDSRIVLLKTAGAPIVARTMYEHEYVYPGTAFVVNTVGLDKKVSVSETAANAYTLNPVGTAAKMDATVRDGLGFDAKATHNVVVLLGVPGAPLRDFDPSKVIYNGKACSANDVRIVDGEPYFIIVRALWKEGGKITGASESFTLKYGEDGTTYTFTWGYKGLNLA